MITAKVVLLSKLESGVGEHRQVVAAFNANYAGGKNDEWAIYTPSLTLNMTLKGAVADKFVVGQAYELQFIEEPSPEEA